RAYLRYWRPAGERVELFFDDESFVHVGRVLAIPACDPHQQPPFAVESVLSAGSVLVFESVLPADAPPVVPVSAEAFTPVTESAMSSPNPCDVSAARTSRTGSSSPMSKG